MYDKIIAASMRLAKFSHRTPVLHSRGLDKITGSQNFFKCENFQRSGSFKFRGAYNTISQLSEDEKKRGIIAYSSGNHAQAVAMSGTLLNIETTVVVPVNIPEVKLKATESYQAKIVYYDPQKEDREVVTQELIDKHGYVLIPPYNNENIIIGQGTTAKEFLEEVFTLDYLLVPCGGGGLLSGCASYVKKILPNCKVIGVEPELANDAEQSFKSGQIVTINTPNTVADGLRTKSLGTITFELIKKYVDDIVTVSEDEIIETMYYLWTRQKIVVEPSGAVSMAPVLFRKIPEMHDKRVGVILSGGNMDVRKAGELFKDIDFNHF